MISNFSSISKRFIISLIMIAIFCGFEGVNETYFYTVNSNNEEYVLEIKTNKGQSLLTETYPCEPIVTEIRDGLYKVVISAGSPANFTYFFDCKSKKKSAMYFNLLFSNEEMVVFFEDGAVIASDIFDAEKKYAEIKRDFTQTAVAGSAILSVDVKDDILSIGYLTGDSYDERYEEIGLNETYCYTVNNDNEEYVLEIKTNKGQSLLTETYPCEPIVTEIRDGLYKVVISAGSPANFTYFFDCKSKKKSAMYFNLLFSNEEMVVFFEDGSVIASDIFDAEKKYVEIKRDFSQTAVSGSAILSVDVKDDILSIGYLTGDNYDERYEEIGLKE